MYGQRVFQLCDRSQTTGTQPPAGPIPVYPGETPQRAEGTTKNRRSITREGVPPGDRISSAAHRPTLQGDRETMREISPRPAVSANCRNYTELPGNYQQPAVSLSKYQQAPGRGTISAGSAAGDRRAAARKFSRNSNGKTPTGGGPTEAPATTAAALRRNTPERQTICRGDYSEISDAKKGTPCPGSQGRGVFSL